MTRLASGAVDAGGSASAAPPVAPVAPVHPAIARSWLLVPGTADALADRIAGSAADVVVVDLEDGVAPDRKGEARRALVAAVAALAESASPVRPWVRIADAASDEWRADVALLAGRDLAAGIVLAKVETADQVRRTRDALDGAGTAPSPTPLVALVESARGKIGRAHV